MAKHTSTRSESFKIYDFLRENIVVTQEVAENGKKIVTYKNGLNDNKVATIFGTTPTIVRNIRADGFGPLSRYSTSGRPAESRKLADRVTAIEEFLTGRFPLWRDSEAK